MHNSKKLNEYSEMTGDLYAKCPKSVFAAIAVSSLASWADQIDIARDLVLHEWWVLFDNGIVPQHPPFPRPVIPPVSSYMTDEGPVMFEPLP